ncbi:hypothetical protein Glove_78g40 [Diversispora epigaea]|uniref:Uncharacterized protein n=1 Tax=Diversispora epigaea TaxID=1348612 RepID=A0A397JJI6_9GLOM|nr:hypothetical protein Glove_78g40 [Diversispora epigaea]
MGLNTCPSDGVTTCVQSPSTLDYDWENEKKSSLVVEFWENVTSLQKRKVETISERATLMEEHATTILKITSQQDQLIRENFTSRLENKDTDSFHYQKNVYEQLKKLLHEILITKELKNKINPKW